MRARLVWLILVLIVGAAAWALLSGTNSFGFLESESPPIRDNAEGDPAVPTDDPRNSPSQIARRETAAPAASAPEKREDPNARVTGRILDERSKAAIADAVVAATKVTMRAGVFRSASLQGPQSTRADRLGGYELRVRFEHDSILWVAARTAKHFTTVRLLNKQHFVESGAKAIAQGFDVALVPLEDAAQLRGRVWTDAGRPARDATLTLEAGRSTRPELGQPHRFTTSLDEYGRFSWSTIPPGRARLRIACDGFSELTRDLDLTARSRIDLGTLRLRAIDPATIAEGATLEGSILDATGVSIPGTRIVVGVGPNQRRASVDESGQYRVEEVPPGKHGVRIEAPQRAVLTFAQEFEPGELVSYDYRFADHSHFLAGTVVDIDDDDMRLEGIEVSCSTEHERGELSWVAKTGENGRFRLSRLPSGAMDLYLDWSEGSYRNIVVRGLTVDRDDHVLRFPMPRRVRVAGYVRDAHGQPIQGAQVGPTYGRLEKQPGARTRTAADGRYIVRVPLTNQQAIRVRVQRTGYSPVERGFRLVDADRSRRIAWNAILFRDSDLATLHGVVRSSTGSPVEGARCHVRYVEPPERGADAVTDDQGSYEIPGLKPGKAEIHIDHRDYRRTTLQVTLAVARRLSKNATLRPLRYGALTIRLQDGSAPMVGQEVTAYTQHPSKRTSARTGQDGTLRLDAWPRVLTRVWIRGNDDILSQSGMFDFAREAEKELVILVRRGAGVIHGSVVTPAGNPLPAELVACHERSEGGLRIHSEVSTDDRGRFRFEKLPEGRYFIDIAGDARHRKLVQTNSDPVRLTFLR